MSQIVTIPSCRNPFEITVNNHTYSYKAGESIELPDEVAEVIKHHVDSVPKPLEKEEEVPGGGENKFAKLVDRSITEITAADLEGVTKIGGSAVRGCAGLTSIEIPNSVTSIGEYAFYNCTSLPSIEIPNSVTSIGAYAFSNCEKITSITLPNNIPKIDNYTFNKCYLLADITIPDSVTSIGNNAFYECEKLTSITIPDSVTSIGQAAFSTCRYLRSVTIGRGVKNISTWGFFNAPLHRVKILPTTPPTVGSQIFSEYATIVFEVPAASFEAYKSATNWSPYADRMVASEEF